MSACCGTSPTPSAGRICRLASVRPAPSCSLRPAPARCPNIPAPATGGATSCRHSRRRSTSSRTRRTGCSATPATKCGACGRPRLARRNRRPGRPAARPARDRCLVAPARSLALAPGGDVNGAARPAAELTTPDSPLRRLFTRLADEFSATAQGNGAAEAAFEGALRARFGALGDYAAGAGPQALDRLHALGMARRDETAYAELDGTLRAEAARAPGRAAPGLSPAWGPCCAPAVAPSRVSTPRWPNSRRPAAR